MLDGEIEANFMMDDKDLKVMFSDKIIIESFSEINEPYILENLHLAFEKHKQVVTGMTLEHKRQVQKMENDKKLVATKRKDGLYIEPDAEYEEHIYWLEQERDYEEN